MKSMLLTLIANIAISIGVPPRLAQELAIHESKLVVDCVGVTGDLGIMQLNPKYIPFFLDKFWSKEYPEFDVFDARHNVYIGLSYLKWLHDHYKVNWWQAIIGYNCGPQRAFVEVNAPNSSVDMASNIITASNYRNGYEVWKPALQIFN